MPDVRLLSPHGSCTLYSVLCTLTTLRRSGMRADIKWPLHRPGCSWSDGHADWMTGRNGVGPYFRTVSTVRNTFFAAVVRFRRVEMHFLRLLYGFDGSKYIFCDCRMVPMGIWLAR